MKEGLEIPKQFSEAPEVRFGLELYMQGFIDISDDRQVGMGLGPITWSTVHNYGEMNGFSEEQLEDFHYYVKGLDEVWLKHANKK